MPRRSERVVDAVQVRRVLAPTGFSPGAEAAVRWAAAVAAAFGAGLTVLHVIDLSDVVPLPAAVPGFVSLPLGDIVEQTRRGAEEAMAQLLDRYPQAEPLIREGPPPEVILEVATEVGADLIAMGTHGRTGVDRVIFGSVAEHVVRHSPVPVLTVRLPRAS